LPFSLPFPKIESNLGKNEAHEELVSFILKTALEFTSIAAKLHSISLSIFKSP
jgi:hypothetical protein